MPIYYAGIDVAKYKHTCCIVDSDGVVVAKSFDFPNTGEGYSLLLKTLGDLGPREAVKVGMEATGHYHANLCRRLVAEGYAVRVQNPKTIHSFRQSRNVSQAKTDKNDALEIALYFATFGFTPTQCKSYTCERLCELSRDANFLITERSSLYNRLQKHLDITFPELLPILRQNADGSRRNSSRGRNVLEAKATRWLLLNFPTAKEIAEMTDKDYAGLRKASNSSFSPLRFARMREAAKSSVGTDSPHDAAMVRIIVGQLGLIDGQIGEIEAEIVPLLEAEPHEFFKIKGLGNSWCAAILGEIGDFSLFKDADSLVKFSGLVPSHYQSGTVERKGHMEKKGSWLLRYALMQAAQKVILHNPGWASYYQKKLSEGKFYKVALSHVAVRLLRTIWLIETKGLKFDPERF